MLSNSAIYVPRRIIIVSLAALCLLFPLILVPFATTASAHTKTSSSGALTIQIDAGIDSSAKVGYWIPVQITVSNNGTDFNGKLSLRTFSGLPRSILSGSFLSQQRFEEPVSIHPDTQQHLSMHIPFNV